MNKKELAAEAVKLLEKQYPDAKCSLEYNHEKPYELLMATRLSAQCTDARVNIVTKELFKKYQSLEDFANADIDEVGECIKSCGLYKTKAKSLVEMAGQLLERFNGQLPDNMQDLLSLSGIGRKTANLIIGDIFGRPAVVTDTHCIRICGRLGLTNETEPFAVEKDLIKILDPEKSSDFCHRLVLFGRDFCRARNPLCNECPLSKICNSK